MGWVYNCDNLVDLYTDKFQYLLFSLNRPIGPIQSLSRDVHLCVRVCMCVCAAFCVFFQMGYYSLLQRSTVQSTDSKKIPYGKVKKGPWSDI